MRKLNITLFNAFLVIMCLGTIPVFAQEIKTTTLYNYKTGQDEIVNVFDITEEHALAYLPNDPTILKLYHTYEHQNKGVGYALISTVLDIKKASMGETNILFNFKTGKKESVIINKLTKEEAKGFIPQHPLVLQLFDEYYKETGNITMTINNTLKDTMNIINSMPKDLIEK